VIKQVLGEKIEAGGLVIGDKVYLMAIICQSFTKLCGHYAATAKSWIANYSDLHVYYVELRCKFNSILQQ
jgi:ubiquitin C-terminal hydrolase